MRKNTVATFVIAVGLSLFLTACRDTKALQENDQLKSQVAQLQKDNGELGNRLETVTSSRDALAKENEALKTAAQARVEKHVEKRAAKRPAKRAVRRRRARAARRA